MIVLLFFVLVPLITSFSVVGYLPEYRYGAIQDWDTLSSHLTHLILFSIEVNPSGSLTSLDRLPPPTLLSEIQKATQNHGTVLMVCVGGAGRSGGYGQVVQQSHLRKNFVNSLLELLESKNLGGVDLNWEQPQSMAEWNGLFSLLKDIHTAFAPIGKTLTMAIHPGQERLLNSDAINNLDLIHLMAYDQYQQHSTFQYAQEVFQQASKVINPSKLTLGIPFYGRDVHTGVPETYSDIVKKHGVLKKNEVGSMFFNGISLVKRKTQYAFKKGMGGVMIWELGQDVPPNQVSSLLAAIGETTASLTKKTKEDL